MPSPTESPLPNLGFSYKQKHINLVENNANYKKSNSMEGEYHSEEYIISSDLPNMVLICEPVMKRRKLSNLNETNFQKEQSDNCKLPYKKVLPMSSLPLLHTTSSVILDYNDKEHDLVQTRSNILKNSNLQKRKRLPNILRRTPCLDKVDSDANNTTILFDLDASPSIPSRGLNTVNLEHRRTPTEPKIHANNNDRRKQSLDKGSINKDPSSEITLTDSNIIDLVDLDITPPISSPPFSEESDVSSETAESDNTIIDVDENESEPITSPVFLDVNIDSPKITPKSTKQLNYPHNAAKLRTQFCLIQYSKSMKSLVAVKTEASGTSTETGLMNRRMLRPKPGSEKTPICLQLTKVTSPSVKNQTTEPSVTSTVLGIVQTKTLDPNMNLSESITQYKPAPSLNIKAKASVEVKTASNISTETSPMYRRKLRSMPDLDKTPVCLQLQKVTTPSENNQTDQTNNKGNINHAIPSKSLTSLGIVKTKILEVSTVVHQPKQPTIHRNSSETNKNYNNNEALGFPTMYAPGMSTESTNQKKRGILLDLGNQPPASETSQKDASISTPSSSKIKMEDLDMDISESVIQYNPQPLPEIIASRCSPSSVKVKKASDIPRETSLIYRRKLRPKAGLDKTPVCLHPQKEITLSENNQTNQTNNKSNRNHPIPSKTPTSLATVKIKTLEVPAVVHQRKQPTIQLNSSETNKNLNNNVALGFPIVYAPEMSTGSTNQKTFKERGILLDQINIQSSASSSNQKDTSISLSSLSNIKIEDPDMDISESVIQCHPTPEFELTEDFTRPLIVNTNLKMVEQALANVLIDHDCSYNKSLRQDLQSVLKENCTENKLMEDILDAVFYRNLLRITRQLDNFEKLKFQKEVIALLKERVKKCGNKDDNV